MAITIPAVGIATDCCVSHSHSAVRIHSEGWSDRSGILRPVLRRQLSFASHLSQSQTAANLRRPASNPKHSGPACSLPLHNHNKGASRLSGVHMERAAATSAVAGSAMNGPVNGSSAERDTPELPGQPLRAILFDVDGTLADSDPLHFLAFREILLELGFNDGKPITEGFFRHHISGRHNPDITRDLFPTWDEERRTAFSLDKEARFRRMSLTQIEEVKGLAKFCEWVESRGLLRAAVTNAPRENAEQMIRGLGLGSFFQHLVIGAECARAKPFPDPYQAAMTLLGVAPHECFAIEDSPAGIHSAVAASLPTVGILTGQTSTTLIAAGALVTVSDYTDPAFWQYVNSRPVTKLQSA